MVSLPRVKTPFEFGDRFNALPFLETASLPLDMLSHTAGRQTLGLGGRCLLDVWTGHTEEP